jgi:hypothetical protein
MTIHNYQLSIVEGAAGGASGRSPPTVGYEGAVENGIVYMYTLASNFWKKPESVVSMRVFSVFEKMKMGKKWEDFFGKACYTGSVES